MLRTRYNFVYPISLATLAIILDSSSKEMLIEHQKQILIIGQLQISTSKQQQYQTRIDVPQDRKDARIVHLFTVTSSSRLK